MCQIGQKLGRIKLKLQKNPPCAHEGLRLEVDKQVFDRLLVSKFLQSLTYEIRRPYIVRI